MGVKTNRTLFFRGNRSEHYKEQRTWRHTIGQNEHLKTDK
jgi:hypothetical protein